MNKYGPGYSGEKCPYTSWKGGEDKHLATLREEAKCIHNAGHAGFCHNKNKQAFDGPTGDVIVVGALPSQREPA
jgi:hypothetical protein